MLYSKVTKATEILFTISENPLEQLFYKTDILKLGLTKYKVLFCL